MQPVAYRAEDYLQIIVSKGSNREITCPDFDIRFSAPSYWLPLVLQQMNTEIKSKLWHLDKEKTPHPVPLKWHELIERQRLTENLTLDHKKDIFLTTQEAAKHLRCSVQSIKNWVDKGELKSKKTLGGHRRIALSTLTSFGDCNKSNQKLFMEGSQMANFEIHHYNASSHPIFIIPFGGFQMVIAIEPDFRGVPEHGKDRFLELSRLMQLAEVSIQNAVRKKYRNEEHPNPPIFNPIAGTSIGNEQYLRTSKAAEFLGISESSLRRNKSISHSITPGGHRIFDLKVLKSVLRDIRS